MAQILEKHSIACDMMHGSDWKNVADDPKIAFSALPIIHQHILEQDDGKKRWVKVVTELSRAVMSAPALTLTAACGCLSHLPPVGLVP